MDMLEFINSHFTVQMVTATFAVCFCLSLILGSSLSRTLTIGGCFFLQIVLFSGMLALGVNAMLAYFLAAIIVIWIADRADKEVQ